MIPLLHDFSGTTVLVFGGGPVAARKARRFAREARVVVVSPRFEGTDFGGAARVRAAPPPGEVGEWLDRAAPALVVAATDDADLNDAVERAAREAGVLVNRADERGGDRDPRSVVVPATVREDPVVVAVATGGTSPAVSRRLREELEESLDGAGTVATVTAELGDRLVEENVAPERRRDAIRAVVDAPAVWTAARAGDLETVREAAEDVLGEHFADSA